MIFLWKGVLKKNLSKNRGKKMGLSKIEQQWTVYQMKLRKFVFVE